jgi:hypothetical protein
MTDSPSFRQLLLPSLFMFLVGWGGIAALVYLTEPLVWMRWVLFALLFLALTGTSLPVIYLFHLRFPTDPPARTRVIIRQAQWVGVYGLVLLWLRWGNLLTLWLTLGLAGGLLAIEWLIRLRERSLWQPPAPAEDPSSNADSHDQSE